MNESIPSFFPALILFVLFVMFATYNDAVNSHYDKLITGAGFPHLTVQSGLKGRTLIDVASMAVESAKSMLPLVLFRIIFNSKERKQLEKIVYLRGVRTL